MDAVRKQGRLNPKETANLLSRMLFIWVFKFVYEGTKKKIDDDDIARPMTEDMSDRLGGRLERRWQAEIKNASKKNKTPSLLKAMVKEFGGRYLLWGVLYLTNESLNTLVRPYCLGLMLTYFAPGSGVTRDTALIAACAIVVINFVSSVITEQYYVVTQIIGVKARAACVSLIYRKCLRLSLTALGDSSPGQIVNLVSNDVSRFELVALFVNSMWAAPLVSLILMVILYFQVGYPGLIGIAVLFTVAPIQSYTGKLSSKYRLQIALRTDERVRLTNEVICGIQVIKMYAWEKPYIALMNAARKMELKVIRKTSYIRGLFMAFNLFTTRAAIFCTLLTVVLSGGSLTAQMVFMMTAYFSQLSISMTGLFVRGFAEIAECLVSTRRLQTFLLKDEYKSSVKQVPTSELNGKNTSSEESLQTYSTNNITNQIEPKRSEYMIELNNVDASWNPASSDNTLKNIDLKIRPRGLTGVIGTVGSGKSSLLQLLLGEIPIRNGEVLINGSLSYAAQEPWIFAGSIRQNILFGQPYESRRYHRVTKVCALERDFQLLPRGDMTLVGERGASLSGGQRARINLARTVYKQADIYLLDDPLSAVDTHVGNHLFKDCIEGFLKGKTTILVTHQLQHLVNTDHLVFLNNGMIEMQGSYHDLQRSGNEYISNLSSEENQKSGDNEEVHDKKVSFIRSISRTSSRSSRSSIDEGSVYLEAEETEREPEQTTNLSGKELYLSYIRSGIGYCYLSMIIIALIITQALASSCDYWVSFWVRNEERRVQNAESIWPSIYFSYVHGGIVFMLFIISVSRGLIFYNACVACSRGLHSNMVKSVVGTAMSFFHNNPSGRILNRFSKDLGSVDELLPKAFLDSGQAFAQISGSLIVAVIVNPWLGIPIVIVGVMCAYLRKIFLKTSKNLKRIEGVARSPVYSHLNATLQGLPTIRAHNAQQLLKKEFDNYQDFHTGATFMFYSATGAFASALDTVCNIYLAIATLSFMFFTDESYGANAGLTITQSLAIAIYLHWGMRQSAEMSNQMTSAERLIEYTKLESEEDKRDNIVALRKDWPQLGRIEMQHVYLKYDHDDNYVLKDVNLTVNPGEKVGIVGRTGAGKSSLITALFRFVKLEGLIAIDGVDTSKLTLETLRSHISIIPQEPVLFSGTLRRNLDPFERFTDNDLWTALEEVEMKDNVSEIEGFGLGTRVMDGGSNFSVGQRQLLCLARAILRNNKILVLDEATANVDPQTDALIQSTIRCKFSHCTVLTIAHRLNTIMDSDRVLVMDSGAPVLLGKKDVVPTSDATHITSWPGYQPVVQPSSIGKTVCLCKPSLYVALIVTEEFDHPYVLLNKTNGFFYSLVQETGKSMALHLTELAKENYNNKNELHNDT